MKSLPKLFHLNLFLKNSPIVKCLPHHRGIWGTETIFPSIYFKEHIVVLAPSPYLPIFRCGRSVSPHSHVHTGTISSVFGCQPFLLFLSASLCLPMPPQSSMPLLDKIPTPLQWPVAVHEEEMFFLSRNKTTLLS